MADVNAGTGAPAVLPVAHARALRKVTTSITITPTQLANKPRLAEPAQLALVRAGIFQLRTPEGLAAWATRGLLARGRGLGQGLPPAR